MGDDVGLAPQLMQCASMPQGHGQAVGVRASRARGERRFEAGDSLVRVAEKPQGPGQTGEAM